MLEAALVPPFILHSFNEVSRFFFYMYMTYICHVYDQINIVQTAAFDRKKIFCFLFDIYKNKNILTLIWLILTGTSFACRQEYTQLLPALSVLFYHLNVSSKRSEASASAWAGGTRKLYQRFGDKFWVTCLLALIYRNELQQTADTRRVFWVVETLLEILTLGTESDRADKEMEVPNDTV